MSALRSYFANAAAQACGRVLVFGANLAGLLLVARLLGIEDFGRYAFVMAYVNIACGFADLGTTWQLSRGLGRTREAARDIFLGDFCILRGVLTVAATLLALAASSFVKPELTLLLVVGSLAVPVVASRFFDPLFQVCERPWYSVVTNLVYAASLIVVSVVILVWARMSLLAYLIGWLVCNLLYATTAIALALRLVRPRFQPNSERLRSILTLAAPLGVGALFYVLNTRVDTLLLSYFRPMQEVGLYGAAYKLLDLGIIAATTLLWPLVPILSRAMSESMEAGRLVGRHMIQAAAVVCLPAAVVAPFLADPVILMLYGPDFAASARVLGVFAVLFIALVFCLAGAVLNVAVGRVKYDYWNTAVALVVNVALSLALIPHYGFVGAAYAALASHLSLLAVVLYYASRNIGKLFVPAFWVRVVACNLSMFVLFSLCNARAHPVLIPAGLLIYLGVVWRFQLLPMQDLNLRRALRRIRGVVEEP